MWWEGEILESKRELLTADHLLKLTTSLLNDEKVMISIINKISKAVNKSIIVFLEQERLRNRINMPSAERIKLKMFVTEYAKKTGLTEEESKLIFTMDKIKEMKSGWFIPLKEKIITDEYIICSFNERTLKNYLLISNNIIKKLEGYLSNAENNP